MIRVQYMIIAAVVATSCGRPAADLNMLNTEMDRIPAPVGSVLTESLDRDGTFQSSVVRSYEVRSNDAAITQHYGRVAPSLGWKFIGIKLVRDWGRFNGEREMIYLKTGIELAVDVGPCASAELCSYSAAMITPPRKSDLREAAASRPVIGGRRPPT